MSDSTTGTATADPSVSSPDAAGDGEPPWYAAFEPADEDVKIYGKYKTLEDAIKSIPHAERRARGAVHFPAPDAAPEEAQKAHRAILAKLGASADGSSYDKIIERAKEGLSQAMRDRIPDTWFDDCKGQATETSMLPWQFEQQLAQALAHVDGGLRAEEDAKIEQQDALEKAMKVRFGLKWQGHVSNVELVASHLDQFLFENSKALEGEDGKPMNDAFTRFLKKTNDPALYAALDHLHDVLLSEGDGSPRRLGGKADDAYSKSYAEAKARWPNRGEDYWASYAREATGGGR